MRTIGWVAALRVALYVLMRDKFLCGGCKVAGERLMLSIPGQGVRNAI